ncbi:nuclear distribution protein nudF [Penicillium sp. IBT 35674x]|nr:nuclear distribution protein nudF [Penicillium sp. IBT 35674x]
MAYILTNRQARELYVDANNNFDLNSVGDDRTIRCWVLSQDARLVKTIGDSLEQFITCIRWGPKQIQRDR